MMPPMRHRLFHAIVMVGASLPMACGSEGSEPPVDAAGDTGGTDTGATDTGASDTSAHDTGTTDSGTEDTGPLDATDDACDGGCGESCFPCIK